MSLVKVNSHRKKIMWSTESYDVDRHLQLNADKTEVVWFGFRSNPSKMTDSDRSIQVGSSKIEPSTVVREPPRQRTVDEEPCGLSGR